MALKTPPKTKKKVRKPIHLNIQVRTQTAEEERQYTAAMRQFLAEWVRQQLGPRGESCTKT